MDPAFGDLLPEECRELGHRLAAPLDVVGEFEDAPNPLDEPIALLLGDPEEGADDPYRDLLCVVGRRVRPTPPLEAGDESLTQFARAGLMGLHGVRRHRGQHQPAGPGVQWWVGVDRRVALLQRLLALGNFDHAHPERGRERVDVAGHGSDVLVADRQPRTAIVVGSRHRALLAEPLPETRRVGDVVGAEEVVVLACGVVIGACHVGPPESAGTSVDDRLHSCQ